MQPVPPSRGTDLTNSGAGPSPADHADLADRAAGAVRLLVARGAAARPHLGGLLLAHLRGVHALLAAWRAPDWVQLAGLCHAFYGNYRLGYALADPADRPLLRGAVGQAAEALAWAYGACDFPRLHAAVASHGVPEYHDRLAGTPADLGPDGLRWLCELMFANEIEVAARRPGYLARRFDLYATVFTRCRDWISAPAATALDDLLRTPPVLP